MNFLPIKSGRKRRLVNIPVPNQRGGVIDMLSETRLPLNAAKRAINLMQVEDGLWSTRWGVADYGPDLGATCDGAFAATKADGTSELLAAAGGKLYRLDLDAGTKAEITGGTLTAGHPVTFAQLAKKVFLANGHDPLSVYNVGGTIDTYDGLDTPAQPTLTLTGLTTTGSTTAYYRIVATNAVGHTPASDAQTSTLSKSRDAWISGTDSIKVSWTAVTDAEGYEIYYSEQEGQEVFLADVDGNTTEYVDDGSARPNVYLDYPTDNTTLAPKLADVTISGNRLWGTGNPDDPYAVYCTGTGKHVGEFTIRGGGAVAYLDDGAQERPYKVQHFRTGKGDIATTVLTYGPNGRGSIWQLQFATLSIGGQISVDVLVPVKISTNTGTSAIRSVIEVGDDVYFTNREGAFSLGSRPTLLNVLATKRLTVNIDSFWQRMHSAGLSLIAGIFYQGRVFWSLPATSDTPDVTAVLDTERNNLNPQAFDIGFAQFLEFTDASNTHRLLAVSWDRHKLSQISPAILGDYGQAFYTDLETGVQPVDRDHNAWARIMFLTLTLLSPQGNIRVSLSGTDKRLGYSTQAAATIANAVGIGTTGWDTAPWASAPWDDSPNSPGVTAPSLIKRKLRINRQLTNWSMRITTNELNARYKLGEFGVEGTVTPTRDPASWVLRNQ